MDIIKKYFPNLTENQYTQFAQLYDLYKEWNEKINVISRKDIDSLYEKHVLHSLGIAKVMPFVAGTKVLDVGTGGGFPGIPLAIMFPETEFHLVDSIGKKILVVQEVAKGLGLKNVTTYNQRVETVKVEVDFVVSRAVTRLTEFVPWIRKKVAKKSNNPLPNGVLYLKGGDLDGELASFQNNPYLMVYELKHYFTEEFFDTKKVVYLGIK